MPSNSRQQPRFSSHGEVGGVGVGAAVGAGVGGGYRYLWRGGWLHPRHLDHANRFLAGFGCSGCRIDCAGMKLAPRRCFLFGSDFHGRATTVGFAGSSAARQRFVLGRWRDVFGACSIVVAVCGFTISFAAAAQFRFPHKRRRIKHNVQFIRRPGDRRTFRGYVQNLFRFRHFRGVACAVECCCYGSCFNCLVVAANYKESEVACLQKRFPTTPVCLTRTLCEGFNAHH